MYLFHRVMSFSPTPAHVCYDSELGAVSQVVFALNQAQREGGDVFFDANAFEPYLRVRCQVASSPARAQIVGWLHNGRRSSLRLS